MLHLFNLWLLSLAAISKFINAVQLDFDLNEPLAQGEELWPIEQEHGQNIPLENVSPKKQVSLASSQIKKHLKVKTSLPRARAKRWLTKIRADPDRYESFLAKKNEYEKQRRRKMGPDKKKEYSERNKAYQKKHYMEKKLLDPNFQRQDSRSVLRRKVHEGMGTEEEKLKYEKMLENDRRYQAVRRAKQKKQKQDQ